jgi:4-hydroxyacetophenone monooxygenase
MEHMILDGKRSIDVKEDAYWWYNEILDARQAHRVYTDPRTRSYYWSEYGRSITNCGFTAGEMWKFIRHPDFNAMEIR